MFAYRPLKRENRGIRLVRLVPASRKPPGTQSNIFLTIDHTSLNDGTSFLAMSYVWGEIKDTITISVNGEPFLIGRNLHLLLEQLRADNVGSWIWVDSICIDQSNNEEKSWQVDQMRDVYTLAHSVYLWLGPGSHESNLAMDFMADVGPKAIAAGIMTQWTGSNLRRLDQEAVNHLKTRSLYALDKRTDPGGGSELHQFVFNLLQDDRLRGSSGSSAVCDGFSNILRRINWHRVWIIQEVALAREALVLCGTKKVSIDIFDATFTAIWCCIFSRPAQLHQSYTSFCEGLDTNLYTIKSLDVRRRRRQSERIRLMDIIFEVLVAPGRPHYSVTDHRDIVFGLLGVVTNSNELGISADYAKTVPEVFSMMTRAVLYDKYESRVFTLDCCPPRNAAGPLPSWVPAWEDIGKYGTRFYRVNQSEMFYAAGRTKPTATLSVHERADPLLLRRQGCRADVITHVMKVPEGVYTYDEWDICRITDVDTWLNSVRAFTGARTDHSSQEDRVWRTVLFDRHDWYPCPENRGLYPVAEAVARLIRKIMRREKINSTDLTEEQIDFIRNGPFRSDRNLVLKSLKDQLAYLQCQWPRALGNMHRNRVIFKTAGGRLGIGHSIVKSGDMIAVVWGVGSPIVLRPQAKGWSFVGDAYVDGLMYGEILDTKPRHEDFDLY
ncbi:heterokaryon incompatibility protein-domain-containing protein [Mariannaea sp. PMI_226]|nr:heterokaryon incompatibility protein-domain-containing protein [Mariannaea sp. PMI_226]